MSTADTERRHLSFGEKVIAPTGYVGQIAEFDGDGMAKVWFGDRFFAWYPVDQLTSAELPTL